MVHAGGSRQRGGLVPRDFQLARGSHGVPLIRGNDAHEIAFANDTSSVNIRDGTFIDAQHLRAVSVGALALRPHHAPMQHPRDSHMLHVHIRSCRLIRNIAILERRPPSRAVRSRRSWSCWPSLILRTETAIPARRSCLSTDTRTISARKQPQSCSPRIIGPGPTPGIDPAGSTADLQVILEATNLKK